MTQETVDQPVALSTKKSDDFVEWYNEIVEVAELTDKRYPIKGMNVWRPYGWKIMRLIDEVTRSEMERTGHDEVHFPLLIPETLFAKEAEQIKGFGEEVFWVDRAGGNELEEPWLLRPTSETGMYSVFRLWIRSHADLPLKTYQIVNVFRYDTKQTRAFMRVREIHFFEDHSCFATFEESEAHVKEDLEVVETVFERLALPHLRSRRPDWDKFPGAFYSVAADVLMPSGRGLQCATVHEYKQNFAKAFDIQYETEGGDHDFVHQTTFGMSERLVGALVGVHGDDQGLVLPPHVAPIQVVVVPIVFKGKEEGVQEAAEKVAEDLRAAGLRVTLDDRDRTAGEKYYHWELRGVPLRIELGPKDLKKKQVFSARRDDGSKEGIPLDNLVEGVHEKLDAIHEALKAKQEAFQKAHTFRLAKVEDARGKNGVVELPVCEREDCGHGIEEALDVRTIGVPVDADADASGERCAHCTKPARDWVRFAKTY